MNYIKTVKHFVSGSDKFFDIFECTFEDVEVVRDNKDRRSISLTIAGKEYKGLFNKKVLEHLTDNEGKPSFVVMWKSPKGNHMLAYSWELWEGHINGDTSKDQEELPDQGDSGEAFLYLWIDSSNDMKYLGYHRGTPDDGYVCSGARMLEEYNARPQDFTRTILAWGTQAEMHELETIFLLQLKASTSGSYYNVSNNLRK